MDGINGLTTLLMYFCCIRLSWDETVFTNGVCESIQCSSFCLHDMYQSVISGDQPADVTVHRDFAARGRKPVIGNWHTHQIWSLFQCQSSQKGIACLFKGFWETAVMTPVVMTTERERERMLVLW